MTSWKFCRFSVFGWQWWEKLQNPVSQHSHFRSLEDNRRVLRAIRVSWSYHTRQRLFSTTVSPLSFISHKLAVWLTSFYENIATGHCLASWRLMLLMFTGFFYKGIQLSVRTVGGRSRAEPGWWVCFIKGTKNVTRQGRTLRTWGKTWLVKKSSGRGLSAWVFNALFHCCRVCFTAGLAQEAVSAVTPLHFLTIGLSLSVRHDVFFMQPFFGRQLSSVPCGGQRLKTTVLGQSAAEADWAEGGQSEGHSGSSVQQEWNWWVSKTYFSCI